MLIADPDELEETILAAAELRAMLAKATAGRRLDARAVEAVRDVVRHHRDACRRRGVPFPDLTIVAIPRLGFVHLTRADLTDESIRTLILNVALNVPTVTALDVAHAIKRAFPAYRPRAKLVDMPDVTLRDGSKME